MAHLLELIQTVITMPWAVLLGIALGTIGCGTEVAERVPVPWSNWVIVTQVYRCSVIDPGKLEIFAQNIQTNEKRQILALSTEEDTHVEFREKGYLTITLPNMVEITSQVDQFEQYKIEFRYVPKDDPVARRNYVYWLHHPDDPKADAWCRENLRIPGIPHEGDHCF